MQRAVSNITRALPKSFALHLAYFGTEHPGYEFNAQHHSLALPGRTSDGLLAKSINGSRRIRALRRLIEREAIDVVVSFGEIANAYNLLTPHRARKVISIRSDVDSHLAEFGRASSLIGALLYRLYRRAETIVCVSKALAEQVRRRTPETAARIVTINNLYPIDEIAAEGKQPLPEAYSFLEAQRFILGVGSLIRPKGFDLLLQAFFCIADRSLLLVLVGRGGEKPALLECARAVGVPERIVFIDHDDNPARYMSRAHLFVLPSRYEGFPNVLVEAMASGAPVVAFDCPTGPHEIIGNDTWGRLVPNGDVRRLASAIQSLLDDETTRLRLKALSRARAADFRAERIVGQWQAVLAQV